MFPTECLMVRRDRKKKTISPVFLGADAEEYFSLVIECFRQNIGKRKHDIEHDLKDIELKVQYNKVIKGLSEIMFRLAKTDRLTTIEPAELRNMIFIRFPNGIPSPEERQERLSGIANELKVTVRQIEDSLYSDKEGEQIISAIPDLTFEEAADIYNLEEAETLISKSTGLSIGETDDWGQIIKKIRRLGLLFKVNEEGGELKSVYVSGPASINENTHRYGVRMSQLLPSLLHVERWRIEADVELKEERSDGRFKMILSSASSDMFPTVPPEEPEILPGSVSPAKPEKVGGRFIFPDYTVRKGDEDVMLFISRLSYLESDQELEMHLKSNGRKSMFLYQLEKGEKKRKGLLCFSGEVPWESIVGGEARNEARVQASREGSKEKKASKENLDQIRKEIEPMLDDFYSVAELLRSRGYDAEIVLQAMGYKVNWKTLEPSIIRGGNDS